MELQNYNRFTIINSFQQVMTNPYHFFNPNSPAYPHLPPVPHLPPFPPMNELSWPFPPPYAMPPPQSSLYGSPVNHPYYNPLLIQQQNNYFSPEFQHYQNQVQCSNPYLQKLLNSAPKMQNKQNKGSKSSVMVKNQQIIEICDDSPILKKQQLSKAIIKLKPKNNEGVKVQKKQKSYKNALKHIAQQSLVQTNLTPGDNNELSSIRKTRVSGKIPKQLQDGDYQPQNQSSLAKMHKVNKTNYGPKNKTRFGGIPSLRLINFSTVVPAMMTQQDLLQWKENVKQGLELRKMSP